MLSTLMACQQPEIVGKIACAAKASITKEIEVIQDLNATRTIQEMLVSATMGEMCNTELKRPVHASKCRLQK